MRSTRQPSSGPRVELSVHPDVAVDPAALRRQAVAQAGLRDADVRAVRIRRRSIDARRGRVRIAMVVELDLLRDGPEPRPQPVDLPTLNRAPVVAVVGAGPAGLFCAYALARAGIKAVVFERGKRVRARRRDLAALTRSGTLHPDSNYCFGEGGAGTFSDGKLYTRADKRGDLDSVLQAFVAYGAAPEILVDARPHIGTNKLPGVITAMREHLESAGVEFVFEARVDGVRAGGGLRLADGRTLAVRHVVVAPGHSARDVQRWMADAGAKVTFKSFALGVRIEHPQSFVDALQFGSFAGHPALGPAAYRLVEQACGAGVFSFCMCPGGFIAPAATEPGCQVVNGWSPSSRGGKFANSGFVTEVGPAQVRAFGGDPDDAFAGVEVQRMVERRAYEAGGGAYVGPAQRLGDFLAGVSSRELPECSYPRPIRPARLDELLGPLVPGLREALRRLETKMPGFTKGEAVAVGVESRTSSPVRFERDGETLQAIGCDGVYPCGEGAGFAGGIMSAALDGIRVAQAIVRAHG